MTPHDARRFFPVHHKTPKYTTFQVSRLGYKKTETPFLFVLPRVFYSDWIVSLNNSSGSLFVVLLCLRSCGTAQVTSQTQPDLRACVHSELPKSPVMTTAALRPVSWSSRVCCQLVTPPLWSTHRSLVVSLTILWFLLLRLAPAPFGLGCVSLCVPLCRSVSRRTTLTRTPDNTGRSHDHSLVGAADRSLAPCAVIPRDDNQSFAVWTCWWLANSGSRVRFPGYLPLRASPCSADSTGQLAQLPLRASFLFGPLSSSTGLVPSLQFYGVGALQFSGWRPPVLGLEPSSSRVGALAPAQSACRFAQNRHNDLTPEALSSASTAPKLCCCCTPRERSSKV